MHDQVCFPLLLTQLNYDELEVVLSTRPLNPQVAVNALMTSAALFGVLRVDDGALARAIST